MQASFYFLVAIYLFGIGIGSIFFHKNGISYILALITSGLGVVLAVSTLDLTVDEVKSRGDGRMFGLSILMVLSVTLITGVSIIYHRYKSTKVTDITDSLELKN